MEGLKLKLVTFGSYRNFKAVKADHLKVFNTFYDSFGDLTFQVRADVARRIKHNEFNVTLALLLHRQILGDVRRSTQNQN